jgi:predicted butyrate kinase (DUF1464 family)
VPTHRKLNRVDLGTAEKVAVAALAIWDQMRRLACRPAETSFILLELGGGFTAGLAVQAGKIIDGIGGTSGPIGWGSSGAWDGEVAYLAQSVTKEMLFRGGAQDARRQGEDVSVAAYQEGAAKAILTLTATLPAPREILLSGRHARDPGLADSLSRRLQAIAPVRHLMGFAKVAKEGAQGAAILAEGLAGGQHATLVETMALRQASGSVLDHLLVIDSAQARRRLGLS